MPLNINFGEMANIVFIEIFSFLELSTISLKHFQLIGENIPGHDIQPPIKTPKIKKEIDFIFRIKFISNDFVSLGFKF
tara:strand:- start:471 stop:704 length:234 start_codon:yes stop_codon:yes gene_type:complete